VFLVSTTFINDFLDVTVLPFIFMVRSLVDF
jgi:hypothetical protein